MGQRPAWGYCGATNTNSITGDHSQVYLFARVPFHAFHSAGARRPALRRPHLSVLSKQKLEIQKKPSTVAVRCAPSPVRLPLIRSGTSECRVAAGQTKHYNTRHLNGAGQMHPLPHAATPRQQKRDLLATVEGFTNTRETVLRREKKGGMVVVSYST